MERNPLVTGTIKCLNLIRKTLLERVINPSQLCQQSAKLFYVNYWKVFNSSRDKQIIILPSYLRNDFVICLTKTGYSPTGKSEIKQGRRNLNITTSSFLIQSGVTQYFSGFRLPSCIMPLRLLLPPVKNGFTGTRSFSAST